MGTSSSKPLTESEKRKQDNVLKEITSYLQLHGEVVNGISSSIVAEHENVKLLIDSIKEFVRSSDKKRENVESFCTDVIKSAVNLLESIQKTLSCQSKALTLSYSSMNTCIHRALDFYRLEENQKYPKAEKCGTIKSVTPVDSYRQHYGSTEHSSTNDWYWVNNDTDNGMCSLTINEKGLEVLKPIRILLWEEICTSRKESETLIEEHEREKEQHQTCQNELSQLRMELHRQTEEIKVLKEENQTLNSKINLFNTEKIDLSKTVSHLKYENQDLARKNEERPDMDSKFRTLMEENPRKKMVQLYFQMKGDLTLKVLDELKSAIVSRMGIRRDELCFVTCLNNSDVNPEHAMLVICINMSRIGTDVSAILQTIKASPQVYLVVLHHKDGHALPSQTSDRVLTGPEFQSLGGIFDLAFLSEKGMYACDMNNKTLDAIVNVIN